MDSLFTVPPKKQQTSFPWHFCTPGARTQIGQRCKPRCDCRSKSHCVPWCQSKPVSECQPSTAVPTARLRSRWGESCMRVVAASPRIITRRHRRAWCRRARCERPCARTRSGCARTGGRNKALDTLAAGLAGDAALRPRPRKRMLCGTGRTRSPPACVGMKGARGRCAGCTMRRAVARSYRRRPAFVGM